WEARAVRAGDTAGAAAVVCAASDRAANALAAAEARRAGIPVAVADAPGEGSVVIPASLRRGSLVVAVSTGGESPALAAFVRRTLGAAAGPGFGRRAELAGRMRGRGRVAGVDAAGGERAARDALPRLLELLRAGRDAEALALADSAAAPHPASSPV